MLKLFIANKNYSSWSLRPWLLMRELEISFDEHVLVFGDKASWSEFRKLSPNGLVPCLVEGDAVIWDSLAICEYLAEEYPTVWPKNKVARAWSRSAAAEMHSGFPALRTQCGMNCGLTVKLHTVDEALTAEIERLGTLWSDGLERFGGPFLAGQKFTAVDAFYSAIVFRIQTYGLKLNTSAQAYVQRMLALDSMQDWYQAGIQETWRDQSHEDDVEKYGEIVTDIRAIV